MSNQNSFFKKPLIQILSLVFAFAALTVSIVFSQNNSQNQKNDKRDEKKEPPRIYESSKSGMPHFPKKEIPSSQTNPNSIKEQTDSNQKEDIKQGQQKQKEDKVEIKIEDKKKKRPIMPSSKSPAP